MNYEVLVCEVAWLKKVAESTKNNALKYVKSGMYTDKFCIQINFKSSG